MIIDKAQLISLLKEKTGLEREKVEDQLAELIKRIQKAAEEDKTFEIEGFGTFSMEEDNLQFEPTDTLETEINNKYAGMKPIELIGAFKKPEGDEVPEIDEERINVKDKAWVFDEETAKEQEASEEPAPEEQKVDKQDEGYAEQIGGEQEPSISDEEMEEAFEMLGSKEDQTIEETDATKDVPEKVSVGTKEKDIMSQLLIAAVIVIAVGVSGWVFYDTGLIGADNSADNTQQATQLPANQNSQQESSQEQSSQTSEANNSSEPEQEIAVVKQEDPQAEKESEESAFGLEGEVNETISSGYTIVVHSLRSLNVAEDRRNNLQEAGYRALINKADVQGTTYYRVGLGQFQTVDNAQQAVSNIPESYQSNQNHFIRRIQ